MATVTHSDCELFYTTQGNKNAPALVLSNSLGTDQSMWKPQLDELTKHFFVVLYDTRGHGQSKLLTNQDFTLETLGKDVLAILDHAHIKTAYFCGISMGGLTGQWLSINAPHRIVKTVVCNTASKIGTTQAWLDRAKTVRENGLAALAEGSPARWFTESFVNTHQPLIEAMIAKLKLFSKEGYAACCEALAYADVTKELTKINTPLLVVAGEFDPVTTIDDGLAIQKQVSAAKFATLPASHISNIEAPELFNRQLINFLL